jgi:hypothetical protein
VLCMLATGLLLLDVDGTLPKSILHRVAGSSWHSIPNM